MSQHIVCQIHARRLLAHTDPHAWKFLRSQMGDDIFDSIVAARAAFFADPNAARNQADIVINHDKLRWIYLIIIHHLTDALAAQVHIRLRLYQNDLISLDHAFSDQSLKCFLPDINVILVRQRIQRHKSHIVAGSLIFSSRISKSCNYIHNSISPSFSIVSKIPDSSLIVFLKKPKQTRL